MTPTAGRTTARPTVLLLLTPLRDRMRWLLAPAALVAALAHIPVIAPHLNEAPYMGALFIVLTVGCLTIAAAAVLRDSAAVYTVAVLTCGLAIIGYIATRLIAFPMLSDDVGDWFEPLGVLSVLSETVVVTTALTALRRRRATTPQTADAHPSTPPPAPAQ